MKHRPKYTGYFICTDNTLKIVIIIGAVVTMTTIIVICTISREDDTHPILAEDEGKNGLLVLPKRHWILYYYNTMYTFSLGNFYVKLF